MKSLQLENGTKVTDQARILREQQRYFRNLFTSNKSVNFSLSPERGEIILTENEKLNLDKNITMEELFQSLSDLKSDKTPGCDGLTKELYLSIWDEIKHILYKSYAYSFDTGRLNWSARRGIVSLLPKKDKDITLLKAWRPLTLLNVDYKILAKTIAERMKGGSPKPNQF